MIGSILRTLLLDCSSWSRVAKQTHMGVILPTPGTSCEFVTRIPWLFIQELVDDQNAGAQQENEEDELEEADYGTHHPPDGSNGNGVDHI
ncbi:hypothetical protein BC936DRAFT_142323 [Jimgerdemannia flammicorona]|uniref:Uncharacterized protein n=1 Tax=Jimgerdemannia flammicorona TaxID=994334 RepID=A0A433DF86_9FUNG|nr:hypothetical protein BC936DRAFT_142323 [Jimgerdemannia flammicorona]